MTSSLMSDTVSSPSSSATSFSSASYLATAGAGGSRSPDLAGSISGYVYLDVNDNGVMDAVDWAISGAEIGLSRQGSAGVTVAYSKQDGSYTFSGLAAGTYSVTMLTPNCQPGKEDTAGVLHGAVGDVLPSAAGAEDHFTGIVVASGDPGTNYNFSELVYPVAAYSKRLLIGDGGVIHTVPETTVPEPGPLMLLATGGLILGGFRLARWRPRARQDYDS
jgi:hypothetical protein